MSERTELESRIYDSLVAFNSVACWDVLRLAQMRQYLAEHLADTFAEQAAEIDRLRAELERPAVEAKRNEIRQSFAELSAQAREDRDYEGAFNVDCNLREREEQWAHQDAADIRELIEGGDL